ncbi:xylitol oxidase [Serinicoccus hydrothermalis]|uniref:Xylitol oxidase n=1 Tax=Serinicoccus hydrothermalis TaxID=1758689 RepID=A0A1B1N8V2_9MICO|nr:FAD-binding protein [Serinicoccus hydrothermalis]ANS77867.1 xylitol oxidase [Serinicoccus hydrothermalis]
MSAVGTTWAKNLAYSATDLVEPGSLDELAEVMASAEAVRVLGSRHSFNRIADTTGTMVGLGRLPVDVSVDGERGLARVEGGAVYGAVARRLQELGQGLHAMASLPHITVAGAVATDTHGSGDGISSLAEGVAAVELVTTTGERVRLERGEDDFGGAVVSLGTLGAVVALELDVEPTYDVAQTVYEGLTWDTVAQDVDAVTGLGTSVSVFTDWRDAEAPHQVWVKQRTDRPGGDPAALGLRPADGQRHMQRDVPGERCTRQEGIPGPWLDRLPHFRLDFTPSNGAEVQSEWLLPRRRAGEAIDWLRGMAGSLGPLTKACEMRTVSAGAQWLSLAQEDCVAFHFTWAPDQAAVEALLPRIEEGLTPLGARPHWGKLFDEAALARRVGEAYPEVGRLALLRQRLDPRGALRNDFLDRLGI